VTASAVPSLAPALDALRLSLHVGAATIWVGGQLTVAGLLPAIRGLGEGAPRAVARALARLLWPAYVVLIATGIWNLSALEIRHATTAWQVVLGVKLAVVALSGVAAWLHGRASSRSAIAAWGALSGLSATTALVLGVVLAG
jgi:putative copper export protein